MVIVSCSVCVSILHSFLLDSAITLHCDGITCVLPYLLIIVSLVLNYVKFIFMQTVVCGITQF